MTKTYIMLKYNHLRIKHTLYIIAIALAVGTSVHASGQGSCPPVGLPIVEHFNTTDSLPTCWERDENFDNAAMKAHIVGSPVYDGIGALMISSGGDNDTYHHAFVMARKLSTSPAGIRLKMKVRANQSGATLLVGACESNSYFVMNYGFVAVDTLTITTPNVWLDYEVDFNGYTGSGDRLAFHMLQSMQNGSIGNEIYIDAMTVERCAVSNLQVSHRSSDELTLHWQSMGDGTANLTVTPVGGGSTLSFDSVSSPFRIIGLSPSTTYTLTLIPQCTGETLPGLAQSTQGTTLPGPHEGLVYCEGFEYSNMPTTWIATGSVSPSTYHSYNGSRSLNLTGTSGYAVLPQIALSNGTLVPIGQLMLNMEVYASASNCLLQIGVTNYPEEVSTITPIDTITPAISGAWGSLTTKLPSDTSGRYIVLRCLGSGNIYLDELRVGRCLLTGVGLAGKTATSVTLEWDIPIVDGDVTIEPIVGGGSSITVSPSQCTTIGGKRRYTINGLTAGSSHSYSIYGSCDNDHCGAATVAVTTFAQDYTIPYCTDFEGNSSLPTDWQNVSTHNNCPQTSTGNHHSGNRALQLSAVGGVNSSHSTTMLPPISTASGQSAVVSFATYSAYTGGTIEVGLIDANGDESTFTVAESCTPSQQWERYAMDIDSIGNKRIAIRYYHNGNGSRQSWIDDLEVNYEGVSGIYAYGERANGATLAWIATGDTVDIQLRRQGSMWTENHNVATSPLTLNGLEEGVTYTFYVRCRAEGVEGCWMYGGSFTTNSAALHADYCHPNTFSIGASLWSLPYLEETSFTGLRVNLEVMGSGTVQVGLMTNPDNELTFTQLASVQADNSTWTRVVCTLTGHEAQGHYIALRSTGSTQVRSLRIAHGDITSSSVSDIGASQATISWTFDGVLDSVRLMLSEGLNTLIDTIISATVTQLTITNLDPSGSYTYGLTAINNNSQSNCQSVSGNFNTINADIVDGMCETFEECGYGSLPNGWTAVSGNSSDPAVYYNSSSNRLRMTSNYNTTAMVALPPALNNITNLKLRAEIYATGNTMGQSMLTVGIMTNASNIQSFVALDSIRPTNGKQVCVLNLNSYSGNGRIIALRYTAPDGSCTLYIDNLGLATNQVGLFTADRITDRSVRLRWNGSQNVHITGSGIDTLVNGATQTIIGGLQANTSFSFTINAIGTDSTSVCRTASVTLHTLAEPMTAPICLSLDDYSSDTQLPYGWTRPYGTSPTGYTYTRYEGTRSMRFSTGSGSSTMVVSPMFEVAELSDYYLSFYLQNTSGESIMEVGVISDPSDTSTFNVLQTFSNTSGWQRCELSLAGSLPDATYIAFRHKAIGSYSRTAYIDHIMLIECPMPTAFISNPRSNSFDVYWNYPNNTADSVIIEWNGNSIHTASSPFRIGGLTSSTNYSVVIRPLCGDSTIYCHQITLTQSTLPDVENIPYCQYFSNYNLPSEWHSWATSGSVNLTTSTPNGNRALRLYAYAGSSVTAIMPQVDTILCTSADSLYLRFSLSTIGSMVSGAQLQLGVVTDILNSNSFILLRTIPIDNLTSLEWSNLTIGVSTAALRPGFLAIRLVAPSNDNATITIDNLCIDYCSVSDIECVELTPTTATFTWVNHGAESLEVSWQGGGHMTTSTSPFTITGLTPNQYQNFSFSAHCPCDHTYSPGGGPANHRMPAEPMEMPICYDMDSMGTNSYPDQWRLTGGRYSAYPHITQLADGNRVLDLYTTEYYPLTTSLEPLPLVRDSVVVSLRVFCNNADAANDGRLTLGLMTNPEIASTFTSLQSLTIDATDTWQTFHVSIPQPSANYVALRFDPQQTYHIYVDDISVAECAVSDITANGNSIAINSLGNPSEYYICITNINQQSSHSLITTTPSPTLTQLGISTDSAYSISVSTICGGDTITCVTESINMGIRHTLPLCEDFSESESLHPYGWEVKSRCSAIFPRIDGGRYHLQPSSFSTSTGDIVQLPMLPWGQTLGGLHLRITIDMDSYSDLTYTYLEIGYIDNGNFFTITELHNSDLSQTHYITLPACNATAMALRARCTYGTRNLYIDNLQLTTHQEPSNITLTQTGYHQQHIIWNTNSAEPYYNIEYGPTGFTPGTGTIVSSDSCHAVLSPLTASSNYDYYFIDTSDNRFCYPHNFTTMPAPTTIPYCTDLGSNYLAAGQLYILPETTLPIDTLTMLLTWYSTGSLIVGAMTDISNPSTFNAVDTIHPSTSSWQRSTIPLRNYTDTGHFAAFRFDGAPGYVGQITLQAIPQPTFRVMSSNSIQATVTADSVNYWLRVCSAGAPQSSGTLLHVTSSPYMITGLSMYSWYDIYTISSQNETTCAPPVTLRTHLDVAPPYCTTPNTSPDGWLANGPFITMPYLLIDSISRLHIYLHGNGNVTLGATTYLDDTTDFVPIHTLSLSALDSHIYLAPYADLIGSRHYIAIRLEGGSVTSLMTQTVARPSFHVLSSSTIEATLPDSLDYDYYIEACPQGSPQGSGTLFHATTSPFIMTGLSMFTWYDLYVKSSATEQTCDPPVTLRTHLDVNPPYCAVEGSDGWHTDGPYHTMPYAVIDTMANLYVTFSSQGPIILGVQPTLDDTTAFIPLLTLQNSIMEQHTVFLADYAATIGNRHYLSFRYGNSQSNVEQTYLHTCPVPSASLFAFDEVRFVQDSADIDYWIEYGGQVVNADTNPFFINNLEQNTLYHFNIRCDSATQSCIPPIDILTGVQIDLPHCAYLNDYHFTIDNLPDGWFTLGGGTYAIMPVIDIDSISRIFMRLRYRVPQTGTALQIGVITNPYDATTFTPLTTLSAAGANTATLYYSFADFVDTLARPTNGRADSAYYIAFHAIGNNPSNISIDTIELQTVPFVTYSLTAWDSVKIEPIGLENWIGSCYIQFDNTKVAIDSLPTAIGGLPADSWLAFNILADSNIAPCITPTMVNTTHLSETPLCDITATLTNTNQLWLGPQLADTAALRLRANVVSSANSTRIAIGTMRLRNIDSTFHAFDTVTISGTGTFTTMLPANRDHFLALKLITGNATLDDITLDHCLTPMNASLSLLRHNVVRLHEGSSQHIGDLWLIYGPVGGSLTTVHVEQLPMDFTLNNSTTYTFTLACDSATASNSCAEPLTITTLTPPPTLSWCEDFDNVNTTLPNDWRMATIQHAAQQTNVVSGNYHTTSRSLHMYSTIGHNSVVVLPDMGLDSLNGLSVSLWLKTAEITNGVLEVGVIFNASDPETFYPLRRLTCSQANTWERKLVDLSDAPDSTFFLALRCKGVSGTNSLWLDDLHVAECGANGLEVTQVEANQITLRWRQTGNPNISINVIPSDDTPYSISVPTISQNGYRSFIVSGLSPLTNYRFAFSAICNTTSGYCTTNYLDTCRVFTPAGGRGCIDPTNFAASYTTCFYGTYGDPVADTGSIDYGYASILSRHTVHYDISERDPRTGNQLRTVPEGATSSVRLGNWGHNSNAPEAEAISYGISVDTTNFNLLIMRYAAVLQDPDHSLDKQPRFSLELLDGAGQVLDSNCGRADFIANYLLGWNIAPGSVLWKDWTTVGVDLTPYAGQTIYVRLTTRDCNEGSHYGYAYFTLECMRKNVTSSNCGVTVENDLTAPSGFNYYWYTSASADTISTNQTIVVPTDNNLRYFCQLAFVDNPSCNFTITAFAGTRYPLSLFDYEVVLAPCSFDVSFNNHSTISADGVTPVGTGESVESTLWILGNGDTVDDYNTSLTYYAEGTYNVSLITGIANDACLDTLTIPLNLVFPPTDMRIEGSTERCWNKSQDTLWLHNVVQLLASNRQWTLDDSTIVGTKVQKRYFLIVDSLNYPAGNYAFNVSALDSVGCTISLSHNMIVHPTYRLYDTLHICSLLLPYQWRDTTIGNPTEAYSAQHQSLSIHRYTQLGCDSVMNLDLTLYNNADFTPRDTAYDAICDNQQYWFSNSLLTPDATLTHNIGSTIMYFTDCLTSSIGCDSLSTIVLTVNPTYDHHLYDTVCTNHSYTWGTPQRQMYQLDSVVINTHANDTLVPVEPFAHMMLTPDTSFTDNLQSISQCDSLSSLHLHLLPAYYLHYYDTICNAEWVSTDSLWSPHHYNFEQTIYDSTGIYQHAFTAASCDSLRTLHLKVYPTYDLHFYDTIYDGDVYTFEQSNYDTTGIYIHTFPAIFACDSLRTLHLQRWPRTYIDTVICQNSLPHTWNTLVFNDGTGLHTPGGMQVIKDSIHLQGANGGDSLVVMTLIVRDTATTTDFVHTCDSLIWTHTPDTTYRVSTDEPYIYLTQLTPFDTNGLSTQMPTEQYWPYTHHYAPFAVQCDSVRHLRLTVDYTHYTVDHVLACDSVQWPKNPASQTATRWFWRDTLGMAGALGSYQIIGPVDTMVTVGGCDSVVELDLAVRYSTYECAIDTFCWYEIYTWRTQAAGDFTENHWYTTDHYYLTETLPTHVFHHPSKPPLTIQCDSVLAIQLTQMARPQLTVSDSVQCADLNYTITLETDVPYSRWNWNGGQRVNEPSIIVSPIETTTYTAYVDYHAAPLCPLTMDLNLRPVVVPEAILKVNPEALRYNEMSLEAYDLTDVRPYSIHPEDVEKWVRSWYIDWLQQEETSWHLHYDAVPDEDTLTVALRVYNGQCSDTTIRLIPIQRVALYAPNAFTPLRDNNQRFIIVGYGILESELYIYNREGLLVYSATTSHPDGKLDTGWDGRRDDGTLCPQGNYVWKLIYVTVDSHHKKQSEVGNVLLIK